MPTSELPKRLACTHCAKTKRKCSKQMPACRRCADKGLVCRYPTPRVPPPFDLVFTESGKFTAISNSDGSTSLNDIDDGSPKGVVALPGSSSIEVEADQLHQLHEPWFLAPSSWNIDHRAVMESRIYFSDGALIGFIDTVRSWLGQWISQGYTPFTHASLYRLGLPESIQDAFTALAAYQSKTPTTERMILQIIEERADRLVEQQALYAGDVAVIMLDTQGHLARTQALLVYCTMSLFDGDIRARSHAEEQIHTLTTWAKQLWQSARLLVASDGTHSSAPPSIDKQRIADPCLKADGTVPSVWHAWLFSESIRRTYITATLVTAAFLTLKQGWAPCPGGITFTAGSGLWEAASPYSWWRRMTMCPVEPLQCIRAYNVLATHVPSDIDEFAQAILIVSYGLEQVKQWKDSIVIEETQI